MVHILNGMFCFITTTVSLLYGTRICWICGKDCNFEIDPAEKKQILKTRMPVGFAIYAFGFFVLFSLALDGALNVTLISLTSAFLLSHFVVSMAMPSFKRRPQ